MGSIIDQPQTTVNLKEVELSVKQIESGKVIKPSGYLLNPQSLDCYYQFAKVENLLAEPRAKLYENMLRLDIDIVCISKTDCHPRYRTHLRQGTFMPAKEFACLTGTVSSSTPTHNVHPGGSRPSRGTTQATNRGQEVRSKSNLNAILGFLEVSERFHHQDPARQGRCLQLTPQNAGQQAQIGTKLQAIDN